MLPPMNRGIALLVATALAVFVCGRYVVGCTGEDPAIISSSGASSCDGGDCVGASAECQADKDCTALCTKCDVGRGKCVFVARGEAPPSGACPAGSGLDALCRPGGCDGTAAKCLQEGVDKPCRTGSCDPVERSEILTAYCAADGTCAVPKPASCGGNTCNGSACARACTLDGECTSTHYCDGKNCQQKKAQGAACTDSKECTNGICADGFCCDRGCTGACERCNGSVAGTCEFVTAATAVHGTCTNQGQDPCGGRCDGTKGDCTYPTTQCQAPACHCNPPFAGVPAGCFFKPAVTCAAGSCATTAETICPNNFTCNGTACHTKPCDDTGQDECYEGTSCKQARNPAMNSCGP